MEVGKHSISRLLKGTYHVRPSLPRYTSIWNVQVVLHYIEGLEPSTSLSLKLLTFKLVMLMALMRSSHSADLASLQLNRQHYTPEGVLFLTATLTKQSLQERILRGFPSQPSHNDTLRPVETLRQYERATAGLRPKDTNKFSGNLTSQWYYVLLLDS